MAESKVVEVEVKEWFADKEGFGTRFIEGTIKRKTDKAILIMTVDDDEVWIPKSVVID